MGVLTATPVEQKKVQLARGEIFLYLLWNIAEPTYRKSQALEIITSYFGFRVPSGKNLESNIQEFPFVFM